MIEELQQHRELLQPLVRFVEGEIEGDALQAALDDSRLEAVLGHFEDARYRARTNHYQRLKQQDRESFGGLLNSQGIIEDFLKKAEIEFTASTRYADTYSLVLDSLPAYLDPPLDFILPLIPNDASLSKTKRKQILKQRLKEAFPCAAKPPRWIQSPDWPIVDGQPLVFIGQVAIDATELFHDTGMAYVFYSPADKSFETIAQFH